MKISIRDAKEGDFENLVDYFLTASKEFLVGMGVDTNKLPSKETWLGLLNEEFQKPIERKKFYYTIWLVDDIPIGHCNVNKIIFGQEAYMHLHMWKPDIRKKGLGEQLVKLSVPMFFRNLELKELFCEPYALNPAPNRVLAKVGFDFVKQYETIPGWINFHQPVNRWRMGVEKFQLLF